jgi:SET domain-containing protein
MFPRIPEGLTYSRECVDVSGWGVIATREWKAGECIGEYEGERMLKTKFYERYGKDIRYVYFCKHNFPTTIVIVAKNPRNFIGYINENRVEPNVELKKYKLWCKRDIAVGQELLLKYCNNYPKYL